MITRRRFSLAASARTDSARSVSACTSPSAGETVLDPVGLANTVLLADAAFAKEHMTRIRFNDCEAVRTRDGLFGRTTDLALFAGRVAGKAHRLALGLLRTVCAADHDVGQWPAGADRAGVFAMLRSKEDAMTWLLCLGWVLGGLAVMVIGLLMVGATRWAEQTRTHRRLLESGRVGVQGRKPAPARFDAHELEGLPAPVQRYFRAVLSDGQPIIAAATIEMAGSMNMSATAEQWKPFTSSQRVVTRRPGFLWDARVRMFPGVPAHVEDSYIAGQGRLIAKLFGLFTVAGLQGDGEIARGEFMRYFAEAAWYPTALLPSQGVRWQALDDASAHATLVDGPITLTLLFTFNQAGLISSVRAASRGAGKDKDGVMVMLPWDCGLSDYQPHDGMLIPRAGEAAWMRSAGRKAYFVGHVKMLHHEFLP